jgi:hypothetical protein
MCIRNKKEMFWNRLDRVQVLEECQHSVFSALEISIRKIKEMPEKPAKLALEILRIFSFMYFDGISEEIVRRAKNNLMCVKDLVIFNNSLLIQCMPDRWDGLLWGLAIRLLVAFSLVTSHSG